MKKRKNMKKIVSILLALVLVLGMITTAFAEEGKITITVNAAAKNVTYSAYKVFDATISGGTSSTISYTIPDGSGIADAEGFDTVFSTNEQGGKTYVSQKEGIGDEAVIAWLKTYMEDTTVDANARVTNTDGATAVTLDVSASGYGYYYITSTLDNDTAVSVTSTNPNATVVDKRDSSPSVDPGDPENPNTGGGKKINGQRVADMEVGETADFTIEFNATNYLVEDGVAKVIKKYTVTDTPSGVAIKENSVSVTVGGEPLSEAQYSVDIAEDTGIMTVVINWPEDTYASPAAVVVSYQATLTDDDGIATNEAVVKYTTDDGKETEIDDPHSMIHTYTHSVAITKIDKDSKALLAGAQFVLSRDNNGTTEYYAYNEAAKKVSWVTDLDNATVKTTKEDDASNTGIDELGTAVFVGLEAGTYTLTEIKAPDGYNLAEPETFTLTEIKAELEEGEEEQDLVHNITVEDQAGSVLPTTGGMGTTLFYIIGGIIVAGAAILLVTRRRMNN